jgi:hypothetical protein
VVKLNNLANHEALNLEPPEFNVELKAARDRRFSVTACVDSKHTLTLPFVKPALDIQPGGRLRTSARTDRLGSWQIQSTFRDTSSRLGDLMFQPVQMGRMDEGSSCRRHSHNCPRLDRRIPGCDDLFRNRFQRTGIGPRSGLRL